ncbi:O-antigen ligase family protein [Halanaerobium congolense]|uniref:O-antigen ligase family protein n=1 Tax=Halanaerobium congolense TaxID=54121 RepID=UPI00105E2196|nr:O-antigen ligase family protein [Halanaerobium congolense]TDP27055.1 O-antigen ligase-like membrane protein [Halanaerobium congolense]
MRPIAEKLKEKLYVLPIVLIAAVVPLIVHYKKINLSEVVASYWIRDYNTDFFSYYKMIFLLGFSLLALISFYIYFRKEAGKKLKKTAYYYPIFIYLIMILLSTFFSKAQLTSLQGFPDRYEGMPVLIAYLLITVITINLFNKKEQFEFLLKALLTSAVIIAIIGLTQFFGYDFFQNILGQKLILPESNFAELSTAMDFRFEGSNILFATFYNPNYAGSYFSMLLMLSTVLYFFARSKKRIIVLAAASSFIFAAWLGSLSRAGILGAMVSTLVVAVILNKRLIEKYKKVLILLLIFLAVFTIMDIYTDGSLRKEFLSLGTETQLAFMGETAQIKELKSEAGYLHFKTEEEYLRFGFERENDFQLIVLNESDQKPDYSLSQSEKEAGYFKFEDPKLAAYRFKVLESKENDNQILEFKYGNKTAEFLYASKLNGFFIIGMRNNVYPLEEVESLGFEGKEMLASKRGYIWSRTLPLIKEKPILGYGPDTFAIFFPQHDVVGKFKYFNRSKIIVDKPHNLYLQIGFNTGLISLAAVLILFGSYFLRNLKLYLTCKFDNYYTEIGLAFLAAFTAYAAAGFFNDSVVSVAPVFWIILGLAGAVELRLKNHP